MVLIIKAERSWKIILTIVGPQAPSVTTVVTKPSWAKGAVKGNIKNPAITVSVAPKAIVASIMESLNCLVIREGRFSSPAKKVLMVMLPISTSMPTKSKLKFIKRATKINFGRAFFIC